MVGGADLDVVAAAVIAAILRLACASNFQRIGLRAVCSGNKSVAACGVLQSSHDVLHSIPFIAFRLTHEGTVLDANEMYCDEVEARESARALAIDSPVELWQGPRRIARYEPGRA